MIELDPAKFNSPTHWATKDQGLIAVVDMTDMHLHNTIEFIRRKLMGKTDAEIKKDIKAFTTMLKEHKRRNSLYDPTFRPDHLGSRDW